MDKFIADLKDCVREVKERPASDKTEGNMVAVYGTFPLSIPLSGGTISLTNLFDTNSLLNLPYGSLNNVDQNLTSVLGSTHQRIGTVAISFTIFALHTDTPTIDLILFFHMAMLSTAMQALAHRARWALQSPRRLLLCSSTRYIKREDGEDPRCSASQQEPLKFS